MMSARRSGSKVSCFRPMRNGGLWRPGAMEYSRLLENQGYNGRHYAMLRVSNAATGDWVLSFTACMNLQDAGAVLMPEIAYSGWHNLVMTARARRCLGPQWSEYLLYGEEWSCELSVELWL